MAVRTFIGVSHARLPHVARIAGGVAACHGRRAPMKDRSPHCRTAIPDDVTPKVRP
ncbi:hypothetical protein [Psychromarinibacter halotolerans]|uniref:Uncharacterized protein n=1 Tax=Psychromarinibacter halotolerans TaxID=1775175 RepID=A0ABV7GYJ4_9RHOB|nr:hypothetical protein [Psychromarinibacter halotolerans]MDF0596126.1 hypothetical protein [Psychromarinibacter halotolerans]